MIDAMLPLDPPPQRPQPRRLRSHRVRTLPALQAALVDLLKWAEDSGKPGPVNLTDFDPRHGVTVSLNDDGTGQLSVKFDRHRPAEEQRAIDGPALTGAP
jgi:hypothetical protein